MQAHDLIDDVVRAPWAHKCRTLLTMCGIAWGICSIALMMAAGEGRRVGQHRQAEKMGKDLIIVYYGRTSLQAETSACVLLLVGVLSGILPAMRASRLDPVEALRYE